MGKSKPKLNIKKAIKHPGALHDMLGIPQGQEIPLDMLQAAAKSPDKLKAERARFALTLRGLKK